MKCPVCGDKIEVRKVASDYKWNKGLPKAFCKKDWIYYVCNKCFTNRTKREKTRENLLCCFVFLPNKIYIWVQSTKGWKSFPLNPSNRNVLGDLVNE